MPKTPAQHAAALLGKRGGLARAAAMSHQERVRIAQMGGRPPSHRLAPDGALERRHGDHWLTLQAPYNRAAKAFLRRHRESP